MDKILAVYENEWILQKIYEVSDRIRTKVADQTKFEDRCMKRIGEYILKGDDKKRNKNYIVKLINEVAKTVIKRNKKEYVTLISELTREDDEGNKIKFEPIDVITDVESEVMKKETIALLAQGDPKKAAILAMWALGNTNNSYISRTLACSFGGNPESYRKIVRNFRKDCQKILTEMV